MNGYLDRIVPDRGTGGSDQVSRNRLLVLLAVLVTACQGTVVSTTPPEQTTTTAPESPATTVPEATTSTVTPTTERFSVPVGPDGVTYDFEGAPPSGPSSYVILEDGSVVIADTMAANRGEPRLLRFDHEGSPISVIPLVDLEVAAIADVASNGVDLAVLDIFIPQQRYRVLLMTTDGDVISEVAIPAGFHLEDGLTGLLWDDLGVLLEFEMGVRYARIENDGTVQPDATPVIEGLDVAIVSGDGRETEVRAGEQRWTVERDTDLGGVSLVGVAGDHSVVLVVDEVDTSGQAFEVLRRVQRYDPTGALVSESLLDPSEQSVEIMRPLELGPDGTVFYLAAYGDRVEITPERAWLSQVSASVGEDLT